MAFLRPLIFLITLLCCLGCKQNTDPNGKPETTQLKILDTEAYLVLNEGLFQRNNSTLSLLEPNTGRVITDVYEQTNGFRIGDTGNDIKVYGNKVYVVVNVSSYISILDRQTLKQLKLIALNKDNKASQPRNVCFADGKAFISCFDGTVAVIDTNTLTELPRIPVGRNPEGIVVSGNYILVANSGGLTPTNLDQTVSVISRASGIAVGTIQVSPNPTTLISLGNGKAMVYAKENYQLPKGKLHIIDANTLGKDTTFESEYSLFTASSDSIYALETTAPFRMLAYSISDQRQHIRTFKDLGMITTPYHFEYVQPGGFMVTDARDYVSNGRVQAFDLSGNRKKTFEVGLNPGAICKLK